MIKYDYIASSLSVVLSQAQVSGFYNDTQTTPNKRRPPRTSTLSPDSARAVGFKRGRAMQMALLFLSLGGLSESINSEDAVGFRFSRPFPTVLPDFVRSNNWS